MKNNMIYLFSLLLFIYLQPSAHSTSSQTSVHTGHHANSLKNYVLIRYPVVDLFNSPQLPPDSCSAAAVPKNHRLCTRIHQALFNEVYEIVEIRATSVRIRVPWAIYGYDTDNNPQNYYWVARKDIIFCSQIPHTLLQETIPLLNLEKRVTLKRPFTSPHGITYSVGTQFVRSSKNCAGERCASERCASEDCGERSNDTKVIYYDYVHKKKKHYQLPKNSVLRKEKHLPLKKQLVHLLTDFIRDIEQQKEKNSIAYVWGGNSFTHAYNPQIIQNEYGFYRDELHQTPVSGYDCSNLILRWSQMVGIPYFFKTTSALEKYGKKYDASDTLEEGDLLWMNGHVVLISDKENNEVIESSGYENYVGKVRIVKLPHLLKNIPSWDKLLTAYRKKEKVMRLDAYGNDYKETTIKIFKLF